MSSVSYEAFGKLAGAVALLLAGWLFTTMANLQRETRQEVEALAILVGKLEVKMQRQCDE